VISTFSTKNISQREHNQNFFEEFNLFLQNGHLLKLVDKLPRGEIPTGRAGLVRRLDIVIRTSPRLPLRAPGRQSAGVPMA
ncbi:hypothetical protein, partial [Salmonella sp. s54395]|uniref:hypothetical protein n=1 Tax=Salmonella sp. s54395 TaxID=3159664 RepID=UPI003981334B